MNKYIYPTNLPKGYGQFPYIIIRLYAGCYQQVPIRIIQNESEKDHSGIYIQCSAKETADTIYSKLMKALKLIFKDNSKPCCLVTGPESAYYIDNNGVTESNDIPAGGSLFTSKGNVLMPLTDGNEIFHHYEEHQSPQSRLLKR